jgi:guanylate kinase
MKKGLLIIISGPSGVGKDTICQDLCRTIPNLYHSVSVTTRPPREGEKDGVNYFFLKKDQFFKLKKENALLEWAQVYNNYYGTPSQQIEEYRKKGYDVILEIDTQGAGQVKKKSQEGVYIFLIPPSMKTLWSRIQKRGADAPRAAQARFAAAYGELREVWNYDYLVMNDDLSQTVDALKAIIVAEKCRVGRNKEMIRKLLKEGDEGDLSLC